MPTSNKKAKRGTATPKKTEEAKVPATPTTNITAPKRRRTRSSGGDGHAPEAETGTPTSAKRSTRSTTSPRKGAATTSRSSSRRRRSTSAGTDTEMEEGRKTNEKGEELKVPTLSSQKQRRAKSSTKTTTTPQSNSTSLKTKRAVKSPSRMDVDKDQDNLKTAGGSLSEPTNHNHNRTDASTSGKKSSSLKKSSPPTIDVRIHRLRHLDYAPSQVLAMTTASSYVALSRANGSVELLEATAVAEYSDGKKRTPHLFPLATIPGSQRAVAHSLCWVETTADGLPSCVAASPDGTLWTVHFFGSPRKGSGNDKSQQSQLRSRITSGGGGVFDLTTCHGANPKLPLVAGACQDGSVRIWQVSAQTGTLIEPPVASLTTAGSAVLSLAWRCVGQPSPGIFETEIYAGVADGTIRKYRLDLNVSEESSTGVLQGFEAEKFEGNPSIVVLKQSSVLRMTVESRGRRTATRIWTMQSLSDNTLTTGNSLGQIQIWDTITGTLVQSINQMELKADVLKLVVNPSETKLFASGVDARVVCLERKSKSDSQWKFTTAQRPHTHDVKSMVIIEAINPPGSNSISKASLETLITGGVDTKLCTYIASDFSKRRPQVWYPWPCKSPVATSTSAPANQLLSIQRDNHVELYRLEKTPTAASESTSIRKPSSEMVGEIAIETQSNLVTSALSATGQFLAVCNASMLFVFQLRQATEIEDDDMDMEPQKMSLPKSLERITAVSVHFHETTLFVADSSNRIHIVDVSKESKELLVSSVLVPTENETSSENLPIHALKTSKNGEFLVAMNKSPRQAIHLFKRSGNASSYSHYWTLTSLAGVRPAAITLLDNEQLAVATVAFQVFIFDIASKKLSPWSEKNGFPIQRWPSELSHRKDFPVRLTFNPINPSQLIMSSFGAFVVMNLDATLPKHCKMVPESHVRRRRKRLREDETEEVKGAVSPRKDNPIIFSPPTKNLQGRSNSYDSNGRNCTICLYYNSMLHLDFMGSDEMIVVEQPWLRVIATFPDALQRRVYGCN